MTSFAKKKFFTLRSYGEGTESGVSWNWQSPKPYISPESSPPQLTLEQPSAPPPPLSPPPSPPPSDPPAQSRPKEDWEAGSANCIRRTTHYSPTSGFITEVSSVTSPSACSASKTTSASFNIINSSPVDKLILTNSVHPSESGSHCDYVTRDNIHSSYATLPTSTSRGEEKTMQVGGLVSIDPRLVTSLAVAGPAGNLITLTASSRLYSTRVEAVNSEVGTSVFRADNRTMEAVDAERLLTSKLTSSPAARGSPLVSKHGKFVSNIQFGSLSLDRAGRSRGPWDSLVTNSLLDLTSPANQTKPSDGEAVPPHLSATVLDRGEDLNNLYRTISRKRILSKVQCSTFHLSEDPVDGVYPGEGTQLTGSTDQPPTVQPLARILARIHALPNNENTYASLASDNVYTSLTREDEMNNNTNKKAVSKKDVDCCPVLLSSLASSQAETQCHALTGCKDCLEYSSALHGALPRLLPHNHQPHCKLHGYGVGDLEGGYYPPTLYGWSSRRKEATRPGLARKKEGKVVCYLAGVILAILALVTVIVVLTLMVANQEMDNMQQF